LNASSFPPFLRSSSFFRPWVDSEFIRIAQVAQTSSGQLRIQEYDLASPEIDGKARAAAQSTLLVEMCADKP